MDRTLLDLLGCRGQKGPDQERGEGGKCLQGPSALGENAPAYPVATLYQAGLHVVCNDIMKGFGRAVHIIAMTGSTSDILALRVINHLAGSQGNQIEPTFKEHRRGLSGRTSRMLPRNASSKILTWSVY